MSVIIESWGDVVPQSDIWSSGGSWSDGTYQSRLVRTVTDKTDRDEGRFLPYYQTEQDLRVIRAVGRTLYAYAMPIISAIENLANYTIGKGLVVTAACTTGVDPASYAKLVTHVQREIDKLMDGCNYYGGLDRELLTQAVVDGEVFIELQPLTDCREVRIARVEPDFVAEPANTRDLEDWLGCGDQYVSSWLFGVHTRKDQPERAKGYHIVRDTLGVDWDYVPADRLVHVKRNVPSGAKRGVSDIYPVEQDTHREHKLRRNMTTGAALQSAIAWIREAAPGVTAAGVNSLISSNAVGTQVSSTERGTRSRSAVEYKPGTILDVSSGSKYISGPMGSERASHFSLVAQYVLRSIGTRWQMPEYMISGDASNGNYASTLVAESPFVRSREADQAVWCRVTREITLKSLKLLYGMGVFAEHGISWESLRNIIDVQVQAPAVATSNKNDIATRVTLLVEKGIMSRQTAQIECGLDPDDEEANGLVQPAGVVVTPAGMQGETPVGGEFAATSTLQWKRNAKAIESALARFANGEISREMALTYITATGIATDRAGRLLDGESDPEVSQAIGDSDDVPLPESEQTMTPLPSGVPTLQQYTEQIASVMADLTEQLAMATIDENRDLMKKLQSQIKDLQRKSQVAAEVLGMISPFREGE